MSTTSRHLLNRQRRLATSSPDRDAPPKPAPREPRRSRLRRDPRRGPERGAAPAKRTGAALLRRPAALGVLAAALLGFGGVATAQTAELRDNAVSRNAALVDGARTSEVKGQVTEAVNAVFSYDYAHAEENERAAAELLTGGAVKQHKDLLAGVRKQAQKEKLVLTTTVTDSGVELIDGDRARVLIFADQRNTRTGKGDGGTTYAAAVFAVDVVHRDGAWKIAEIGTFNR